MMEIINYYKLYSKHLRYVSILSANNTSSSSSRMQEDMHRKNQSIIYLWKNR